ncbi:MAG: esterase/lipase family protein [Ramlibacter sp.]
MPASRLARLQQAVVLGLVAVAALWAVHWWPGHRVLAVVGAAAILCLHAVGLALEFVLLAVVRNGDRTPRAGVAEMVRAWWRESVQGVRVFGWRQPFAWTRMPDRLQGATGATGLVFIHGFVCNRGFWTPWLVQAAARGHPYVAVNLEPVFGSIDAYAPLIEDAVARVTAATGRPPVLVCHSMGGLAARAWLRTHQGANRVAHVVTIGTPHAGTWLARFSRVASGRQMRMGGQWLVNLATATAAASGRFTCWYANCDNIVFPPSTATLPGADNRLVPGAAHVDLAFRRDVMEHTFALARDIAAGAHRPEA